MKTIRIIKAGNCNTKNMYNVKDLQKQLAQIIRESHLDIHCTTRRLIQWQKSFKGDEEGLIAFRGINELLVLKAFDTLKEICELFYNLSLQKNTVLIINDSDISSNDIAHILKENMPTLLPIRIEISTDEQDHI